MRKRSKEENRQATRVANSALLAFVSVLAACSSSSAPVGATCILLAIGGDPANLRAFIKSPQTRFGGLARGESVLYGADGSRVAIRQGGTVEILTATLVRIKVPNVTVDLGGTGTLTLLGTLMVSGDISDQNGVHGTLNLLRTDHNGHEHPVPDGTSGLPSLVTP